MKLKIGKAIDLVGSRFELVAQMGEGPNDAVLFRTRMAPGKLVPLHSHIDPECFYVLDGQLDIFLLDDAPRWHTVEAGKSLLVADGVKHGSRNSTKKTTDMALVTNNRFAEFLQQAGRTVRLNAPFDAPTPDDIKRMHRVSNAFGYWNASPEDSTATIHAAMMDGIA